MPAYNEASVIAGLPRDVDLDARADVVGLAELAFVQHQIDALAVVEDELVVAHLAAVAIMFLVMRLRI